MNDKIQLHDPLVPSSEAFMERVKQSLAEKDISSGQWTEEAERRLCDIHECEHAVLTDSGTMAFRMALHEALSIFDSPTVEMQDFTWASTKMVANALCECFGVELCFQDVERDTFLWWQGGKDDTLAIPNLTFGNKGSGFNLPGDERRTIMDAAFSFGTPSLADLARSAILSFSPAKLITACEGGAVLTNDSGVYEFVKHYRRYLGRPSELNAAFLVSVLEEHGEEVMNGLAFRAQEAKYYDENSPDFFTLQKNAGFHTRGEIAFVWDRGTLHEIREARKRLSEVCEVRQRYWTGGATSNVNCEYIYKRIFILPYGVSQEDKDRILDTLFGEIQ